GQLQPGGARGQPHQGPRAKVYGERHTGLRLRARGEPGALQERRGRLLRHYGVARARRDHRQLQEEGRPDPRRGQASVPYLGGPGRLQAQQGRRSGRQRPVPRTRRRRRRWRNPRRGWSGPRTRQHPPVSQERRGPQRRGFRRYTFL
ncbi:MAG: Single-stranded DNA-binding protein, partial [uncultured Rubrobacteraceae bacterium]